MLYSGKEHDTKQIRILYSQFLLLVFILPETVKYHLDKSSKTKKSKLFDKKDFYFLINKLVLLSNV